MPATCQHELRPGTKVCLHCRRAEREARAARQRAILVRLGIVGAAVGACAYAGVVGYRTWQGQGRPTIGALLASPASLEAAPVRSLTAPAPAAPAVTATMTESAPAAGALPAAQPAATEPASTPVTVPPPESPASPASAPPAPAAPVVAAPAPPILQPVVAEGRTELQNGIYALRRGDTVTVHFDTPEARTRRPEKFEQIVRATLPAVHGATAQSILATIATGDLVGPGATITEPRDAIALRGNDGRTLSVVPQTRPGRDGPLVVAYRVTQSR